MKQLFSYCISFRMAWFAIGLTVLVLGGLLVGCTPSGSLIRIYLEDIDADTTLLAGTYYVKQDLSVSGGATLTLLPGVRIVFEEGHEMTVTSDGKLQAVGTKAKPIVLTGEQPIRGYWGGLRFSFSNSMDNRLEYVKIQYGGGYWDGNLYLTGGAASPTRIAISNCTFQKSGSYGILTGSEVLISSFSENTLTNNTLGAAQIDADHIGFLDDASAFSGNDVDIVNIETGNVTADATWPGIDVPYFISKDLGVSAALMLSPGAMLMFDAGNEMTVQASGSLEAIGTALEPIVFTGAEALPGYWGGLRFYYSNSMANALDYVTIEYGGGYWDGNLYLTGGTTGPTRIAISNCTFQESGSYGILTRSEVLISSFSENTLTNNTLGAAQINADHIGFLDDASTFSGNDIDVVNIEAGNVTADATWPGIDVPYFIGKDLGVSAALTLSPGTTLMFDAGNEMTVQADGSLEAIGTALEPIVFTGAEALPGYWGGLRFYYSNSTANALDYVTIEYGGGYWDANLYLVGGSSEPTRINVTNSHFTDSGSWGVLLSGTVNANLDIATANTFSNNTDGDISGP